MLLVAPLSGHFATLLRDTVRVLLPEHDVHITDWANARDVGMWNGRFGFDEYVEHLIKFLEAMGPGAHVIAVCQPCVQALAAAAIMAEDDNPAQPRSMTLMAGPIDTRVNPTKVNELAMGKPIGWFEQNLISRVPLRYPGATRRVYPGFVQLTAFMSMNAERHIKAQVDLYKHLAKGEIEQADTIKDFYDEYFAVLDMAAEFYLETVQWVFQEHRLAKGELDWKGRRVNPKAIRRTALFTDRGRARRHLRHRPDRGRPRPLFQPAALSQEALYAGRRRPLRRVQRPPLGQPDLSLGAKHDSGQRVAGLFGTGKGPQLH